MRRRALVLALTLGSCASPRPSPRPSAPEPSSKPGPAPTAARPPAVPEPAPPAAEAPPAPPYDLAADMNARAEGLRAELGARVTFEVVEGVFLISSPSGGVGGAAKVTNKALGAYFNGRFARRPERAVSVLLFDGAPPYNAYCKAHFRAPCPSPYGFYASDERAVVMNAGPGLGTLTHELVHPIVEADFPGAPDWLNEGIASLYEAFSLPRPGEIRGHKNWRLPRLLDALRSPAGRPHANLPALFAMTDGEFRGDRESLNYALARLSWPSIHWQK